jgi:N4-gp56 family major capsid protein
VVGDLMADSTTPGGWQAVQVYGQNPAALYNGEVGKCHGTRFITTTRAKTFTSTTTVYATMVGLGPWAFGKAAVESLRFTAVPPTPDHADPLGRTWILGYAMDWGVKTLDSTKFLRFESAATSV